jgi:hypothetical protein
MRFRILFQGTLNEVHGMFSRAAHRPQQLRLNRQTLDCQTLDSTTKFPEVARLWIPLISPLIKTV